MVRMVQCRSRSDIQPSTYVMCPPEIIGYLAGGRSATCLESFLGKESLNFLPHYCHIINRNALKRLKELVDLLPNKRYLPKALSWSTLSFNSSVSVLPVPAYRGLSFSFLLHPESLSASSTLVACSSLLISLCFLFLLGTPLFFT